MKVTPFCRHCGQLRRRRGVHVRVTRLGPSTSAARACEHREPGTDVAVGPPKIEILDFEAGARAARGVAVIIDVFRAFSVACYAFANGADRIIPVADIEEALRLRRAHPEFITLGER